MAMTKEERKVYRHEWYLKNRDDQMRKAKERREADILLSRQKEKEYRKAFKIRQQERDKEWENPFW